MPSELLLRNRIDSAKDSMAFPSPTEKQAKILWLSLTLLAVAVLLALVVAFAWLLGWVLRELSSVLFPLAIAGIIAYLLDPVVDFLERKRMNRTWAIMIVFLFGLILVGLAVGLVVPKLVVETQQLMTRAPDDAQTAVKWAQDWLQRSTLGARAKEAFQSDFGSDIAGWLQKALPVISEWIIKQMNRFASWIGLFVGLSLVPVYLFYFLKEKSGISKQWTDYLPVQDSWLKDELVFVLRAINDYLIVFFRAQFLVAMSDGVLLMIGFSIVGLNYAILLGLVAGLLSIIPYLGITLSLIPTVILAAVQFQDWQHPAGIAAVFIVVHLLEGYVIAPKIMGERVGLHPLTIIIAVMVGIELMGGVLGGLLAIPLTAALRVVMFRYVWRHRNTSGLESLPQSPS